MCIWMIHTMHNPSKFFFDNAKLTLILAETKNEGKVVTRLVFTTKEKIDNLVFDAFVPFQSVGKPILRQNTLLDEKRNKKIKLSMIFGEKEFKFHKLKKRNIIFKGEKGKNDNKLEKEVNVLEEDKIEINKKAYISFPESQPESSHITIELKDPIEPGTYVIKFLFYIKKVGEEFFEHLIFEKGRSIKIPVFHKSESRDDVIKELSLKQKMIIDPKSTEFFLVSPSNVVANKPQPEKYKYILYKKDEEISLGKFLSQKGRTEISDYDFNPHRGRNQFKWLFGDTGETVSFQFLTPPITPIFIFYSILLFDLLIGLYIFGKYDIQPIFSFYVSIFWILLLNYFAYSLIKKPSILGLLSKTMVRIGYANIFWQVFGCILFVSVECFAILIRLENVFASPWIQVGVGIGGFLYVSIVEFRSGPLPAIIKNKFLELNPSKWEIIKYVAFSWNIFLYSAAITVAAFGTDLLLRPNVFHGQELGIAVFFSLSGFGAFGGKVVEILKGKPGM